MSKWFLKYWYQNKINPIIWPLIPLSYLFLFIIKFRFFLYKTGLFKQQSFSIPIIVVGNLTVGGTGKTPLVIHIAALLQQHGFKPGIVSRGYRGQYKETEAVEMNSHPTWVGDEPLLMANRLFCPIRVSRNRAKAVELLLQTGEVNIVISDDGLQHYAMGRTIEIIVLDSKRKLGNQFCLPAGPLREPVSRLKTAHFVVVNGSAAERQDKEYEMALKPYKLYNPFNKTEDTLSTFQGKEIHAIAGIGHPERFFDLLEQYGLKVIPHPFPDHHHFSSSDIEFEDEKLIFMTEKDAVKCLSFMNSKHWVLAVNAMVDPLFDIKLLKMLQGESYGQKVT